MWVVHVRHDGKLHRIREYPSQNLARWWAINWLANGWVPVFLTSNEERLVPASAVSEIILRQE